MMHWIAALSIVLCHISGSVQAFDISLERPGDREFVRDGAVMLTPQDKAEIVAVCDRLLTDKATPVIVITIERMNDHGADGMRIETFARLLFDQWEIGHAELNGQVWNTGILLLVSKGDRKARIELGAGWHRDKDQICKDIMDGQIISRFKQHDFSGGVKAGVIALDAMAREVPLAASSSAPSSDNHDAVPQPDYFRPHSPQSTPAWFPWAIVILIGLAVFTAVSLVRNGSSGWAWLFWGAVFTLLGTLLYVLATTQGHRRNRFFGGGGFGGGGGSGGGFSGGSFGGGFSGGGGASGSW